MVGDDPLRKTPADKLVIARQKYLAARNLVQKIEMAMGKPSAKVELMEQLENAQAAQAKAMEGYTKALREFDVHYGGAV